MALLLIMALHAQAAAKPVFWTDKASDANAISALGLEEDTPLEGGYPTPAGSDPARDVLKTELANTWVKQGRKTVCTGFTATLSLKAAPVANTMYRIQGKSANNPLFVILQHDTGDKSDSIRYGKGGTPSDDNTIPFNKAVKTSGSKIIFTVNLKDFKAMNERAGSVMHTLKGSAASSAKGLLYVPIFDTSVAPEGKTFRFCG